MANSRKVMDSIKNFLLNMKALDEQIPEELAQDALAMTEEVKNALEDEEPEEMKEDNENIYEEKKESEVLTKDVISKMIREIIYEVLLENGVVRDSSLLSLDELEEEILEKDTCSKDENSEEEVTVDPEIINNQDSIRNIIRDVKPIIASVKDEKQRKALADAFSNALRIKSKTTEDYGNLLEISRSAKDNLPVANSDIDLGQEWAKKFNPHYKEVK